MRIGFDVSQTGRLKAGCGYFADSLIRHLVSLDTQNTYVLYPTFGDVYWDPDWPTATYQIDQPNCQRGLGHDTHEATRLFWSSPATDFEMQLGNPDVIHANNFFCPLRLQTARLVYTLYDLGFVEYPEWTTEANRLGCFAGVFNASLYADLIVAISNYSRQHFLDLFPYYPAERVVVVYPASRFSALSDVTQPALLPSLQPHQFWLSVGTLEPRKNHLRLLQAYARLKTRLNQCMPLVLAGGRGWLMDDLERMLEELDLQRDVILLGYVDDPTLQWLYQHCFAFVYPSLFEGFGLPVLEAMSLGAPVITSRVTSIPEIVVDAGILVDPRCEEALCGAMLQLATDPQCRAYLREKARRQAAQFSWQVAAQAVLTCYQEAFTNPRQIGHTRRGV
jgi:glycosyltransferase involved in cell wall biosynthesis